jgi:phosphatidate cytidylyltransferase
VATTILAAAIGCVAAMEAAPLFELPPLARPWLLAAAVAAPLAVLLAGPGAVLVILTVLLLAATLVGIAYASMPTMVGLALGVLYPIAPLSLLVSLEMHPRGGPALVIAIALAVGLSDVGAFVFGRCFGRRPLAPKISPAKTWAGVVGNLVGASLGLWLVASLLPATTPLAILACTIGLGAVWGDLLESMLKRGRGVKDSGAVLPGFGGLLDRIDSLLVVLPLVALVIGARP